MMAWNDYKKIAKERGALALELFVIESVPGKAPDAIKENLPAHLAYQSEMEKQGVLFLAGPLSDASGEEMIGAGLIIYRAPTMQAARDLANADPMHSSGARSFSLRKWLVNEGNLSTNIGLSTGIVQLS